MRKTVNEVFTPRNENVNDIMYIEREALERSLYRSITSTQNSMLFGESGNGKSWLYKRVLDDKEIYYVIANCAHAREIGSITDEIYKAVFPQGRTSTSEIESTTTVKGTIFVAEGAEAVKIKLEKEKEDKLTIAYREINSRNKKSDYAIIVLDNVETIYSNKEMMREIGSLIILLDDPYYAQFKVKFLIVGLPKDIIDFFKRIENCESVGNRLNEIEKVGSLSPENVKEVIRRGFIYLLDIPLTEKQLSTISEYVCHITLGIAQKVQEYCRELAFLIQDNKWLYSDDFLVKAGENWMKSSFRQAYSKIEVLLNSNETRVGRRNQVVFCIGKMTTISFGKKDIELLMNKHFLEDASVKNLGVSQILIDLSSREDPIIRRTGIGSQYEIVDPIYLMVIRFSLVVREKRIVFRKIRF